MNEPAPEPAPEAIPRMPFDHEMLDVYGLAVDFVSLANDVVEALPRGREVTSLTSFSGRP